MELGCWTYLLMPLAAVGLPVIHTDMATVAVPRRALARWRVATALQGLGLGTSMVGLGWDYYVHEVAREVGESLYAPPHLLIFAGIGIVGLGFLMALSSVLTSSPRRRIVTRKA